MANGTLATMSLLLIALFCLTTTTTLFVSAAHSRHRIVIRRGEAGEARYDRSITTFSSDGRLAQVEYGMEASARGSTVAALKLSPFGICWVAEKSSFGKVHRIDHHLWLVTSGLSGDARALANALRSSCQNHRLNYGESPSTQQCAKFAGQLQHELTRTGGARPLGCTAIVIGMDPTSSDDEVAAAQPRLYQTDPGGIVEACQYCAAGKGRENVGKVLSSLVVDDDDDDDKKKASINTIAADMAELVLQQLDDPKNARLDVWTLQPNPKRRGGMQATCYRNIGKDSVSTIREQPEQS
jgi:20S proteasome alpha/beta subunit